MAPKGKDPLVFLKAKSTKIILAITCVALLVILAVPLGIRYALQSYLMKNGATDAVISSLSINPFAGTVKVKGVRVEGADKRLFGSSDFDVDVKLLSLFQKEIEIETAYYDQLTIDLRQEEDGRWHIASYTSPLPGDAPEDVVVTKEVDTPSEWNIRANQVLLTNCTVDLTMPEFSTKVVIEKAELTNFTTKADDPPARFEFAGSVDGSPLNIVLESFDVVPYLAFEGNIDFQGYDLSRLQKILAPNLSKIVGTLSLKGDTAISFDKSLHFSYTGDLGLDGANIVVADNTINSGQTSWQGIIDYTASTNEVTLDGELAFKETDFLRDDLNLSSKSLSLKGPVKLELENEVRLITSAALNSTGFQVKMGTLKYVHDSLSWSGDTKYTQKDNNVSFNGKLKLAELDYSESDSAITAQLASLLWTGKGKYLARAEHLVGGVDINAAVAFGGFALSLPGETPMDIRFEKADIKKLVTGAEQIKLDNVLFSGTKLYSPLLKKDFLEVKSLDLNNLVLGQGWVTTLAASKIDGLKVFPRKDTKGHTGTIASIAIADMQWSLASGVKIKNVTTNGLNLQVVRDKQGSLNLGEQVASLSAPKKKSSSKTPPKDSSEGGGFRIDTFEIKGKNTVYYKDYTLEVPFESESEISSVVFKNLDSNKPNQDSALLVKVLLEKRAPLKVEGTLRPFAESKNPQDFIKLKYTLKNYPIRNLSPYAVQNVGTALRSGELRLDGDFTLSKGVVDSNNELMLKRLTTKAMSADLAAKVDDKLPIPLDAALALLRDSDDNISLSLPIDGPVEGLNFDVSDAIIIALGKAVVPAASSYLVYALGPYAALAYVGLKIGENVLEVRLPPVKFVAEQVELTAENKGYLKRVGKLLKDGKTKSDVQVCPVVSLAQELGEAAPKSEDELDAETRKEFEELGQSRANVVRTYLVEEYGVEKDRLLLCVTTIEKKGDSEVLLHAD